MSSQRRDGTAGQSARDVTDAFGKGVKSKHLTRIPSPAVGHRDSRSIVFKQHHDRLAKRFGVLWRKYSPPALANHGLRPAARRRYHRKASVESFGDDDTESFLLRRHNEQVV